MRAGPRTATARSALLVLTGLAAQVPVDPDAQTAREWAEAELAQPIYHQRPSLLRMVLDWVLEQLARAQAATSSLDPRAAAITVALVLLVGGGIALVVAGPVRRARRARGSVEVFGGDDRRTAAELRAGAEALAAQGQWTEAVLDRFRAILRDLEDRVVLDPRPGRTAHEAAERAGVRLPGCAADLRRAARLFDDLCYGSAEATRDDDAWLREVDQRVAASRPAAVGSATSPALLEVPR